jgi:glutamate-1-semialdehyde 2,1-aminomutase
MPADGTIALSRQEALLARARALTPGGVHSNVRMLEQPSPRFLTAAHGAHVWDADGAELIDYVMGQGPMLLGHDPAPVLERVAEQLERAVILAGQHEVEVEVACRLAEMIPGAERVRFGTTGTEAILAATRIARAATGRRRLVKFRGHYHGWNDALLYNVSRDSAWDPAIDAYEPIAETAGLPSIEPPIVLDWNDPEQLASALARYGDEVAAVVMEPVMANVYVIPPEPGYLDEVRRLCDLHGVLLILDEIITGFRLARGGAQERFGVRADLVVFGKALASGFPVSCVAGRAELLELVATGEVMLAGTFNSNPVALAAASAVLEHLTDELYSTLTDVGSSLLDGLRRAAADVGSELLVQGYPQLFGIAATTQTQAGSFADTLAFDKTRLGSILTGLISAGVRASGRGTFFLSSAHDHVDVDRTVVAMAEALKAARL